MWLKELESIELVRNGMFTFLAKIDECGPQCLTYLKDSRFLPVLKDKHNVCVITTKELSGIIPLSNAVCVSDNPERAFFEIHNYLAQHTDFYGTVKLTDISESAIINEAAYIDSHNVRIGNNVRVDAGAIILRNTHIEDNVIIQAGTVIGADGYKYMPFVDGTFLTVKHAGGVHIHRDVEIASNSVVAKGIFNANTIIGEGTKIDNLVHISHQVQIGKNVLIVAGTSIGGFVKIGDNVWISLGTTIKNGVHIGDNAFISMGSVVINDAPPHKTIAGMPARVIGDSDI